MICYDLEVPEQFSEEFLSPLGTININREVPGEPRWIDVWFEPSGQSVAAQTRLGLLGKIGITPCVIEAFRQQPPLIEVFNAKLKLFTVFAERQRQIERRHHSVPSDLEGFPWLWILSASASPLLLTQAGLRPDADWPTGVYCDRSNRTALIAINQLPVTADTLWVRLLGKGATQQQAIAEILAFSKDDLRRLIVLQLLVTWKINAPNSGAWSKVNARLFPGC